MHFAQWRRGLETRAHRLRGLAPNPSRPRPTAMRSSLCQLPARFGLAGAEARAEDENAPGKVNPQQQRHDPAKAPRSEEHTSELQSRLHLACRLLLDKNKV